MVKCVRKRMVSYIYFCWIFLFASFSYQQAIAEEFQYEKLGEYEIIFREFENQIELEEMFQNSKKAFFLKKWTKKTKRWFKKRTYRLFRKLMRIKKLKNGEDCAYTIARFKRKIDKRLYHTGDMENKLSKIEEIGAGEPWEANITKFTDRVRYYYNNKGTTPKKKRHRFVRKGLLKGDLEEVPTRSLIGCVEVGCSALIAVLPFPGCTLLATSLFLHGSAQIYEGYIQMYEREFQRQSDTQKSAIIGRKREDEFMCLAA